MLSRNVAVDPIVNNSHTRTETKNLCKEYTDAFVKKYLHDEEGLRREVYKMCLVNVNLRHKLKALTGK